MKNEFTIVTTIYNDIIWNTEGGAGENYENSLNSQSTTIYELGSYISADHKARDTSTEHTLVLAKGPRHQYRTYISAGRRTHDSSTGHTLVLAKGPRHQYRTYVSAGQRTATPVQHIR
jgi:hypothetical protein